MNPDSLSASIHTLRGCKVVLDVDLARLYDVTTKAFNQAIRRNAGRFPKDFAFQLRREEVMDLRSQFVTSSLHGGRRYVPWAFTEHGAVMASMVLTSKRAVAMSVYVVRAFVRMREGFAADAAILNRLAEIDGHLFDHDVVLRDIFQKLRQMPEPPPETPTRKIGFHEGNR